MKMYEKFYLHNDQEFINYWKDYFMKNEYSDKKIELYIDYPFCRSICNFCVYGSYLLNDKRVSIDKYEENVINIIKEMYDVIPSKIHSIYFGGGTASLSKPSYLKNIRDNIKNYKSSNSIIFESHPIDLKKEYIDFLIDDMKVNLISMGIQSFDRSSIIDQKRIYIDKDKLFAITDYIHSKGCRINIDLILNVNDYSSNGIEIFEKDLNILNYFIKPDKITLSPNFLSNQYMNDSKVLRSILNKFKFSDYYINPYYLSMDDNDIYHHASSPYEIVRYEYIEEFKNEYMMDLNDDMSDNKMIIIGFGGSPLHPANSINSKHIISSFYDENIQSIIHSVSNKINYKKLKY